MLIFHCHFDQTIMLSFRPNEVSGEIYLQYPSNCIFTIMLEYLVEVISYII